MQKIHITIFAQYYNLQNEVKEFKKVYTIAKLSQFHKIEEHIRLYIKYLA